MTNTPEAAQILRQRLTENPRLPAVARHVMAALATDTAKPAWAFFSEDAVTVGRVLNRVRQAFEQSLDEVSRPSATNEAADLKGVIKKARDLQRAIKTSSLPGDWVRNDRFELLAEGMQPVAIDLGWHSLRPDGYDFGYPLSVCDVLDWAVELVQQRLDDRPARSLVRQKDQPELTAFVRRLAWHFNREFQQEHRTAIAHIASAVFDLTDPLDVKGVDGRLKDRKKPFVTT